MTVRGVREGGRDGSLSLAIRSEGNETAMLDADLPAGAERVVSPVLVGRDDELNRLLSAVAALPSVVTLEGEAGVGKTRFVSELRAGSGTVGRVLDGACQQVREAFPLGPVIEAIRTAGEDLRGMRLGPVAGALRPLLPELATVLPKALEPLDDRVAERHRVFRGLADVLTALSPATLILEDLHWADGQTIDFASYLLADSPPELALVLTYRSEEVTAAVRALTARLPAATTHLHIALEPLDARGTGALAGAILGAQQVSEEFSTFLWERTAGVPFAVEEVLALVRSRGQVVRRDGRWSRRALDKLEVPPRIRDSTMERVSRLPAMARQLAEAAAVVQRPVPASVLEAMTDEGAIDGLTDAIDSGLLAEYDESVGFRHLLAAQAVYETLSSYRRRTLHDRAATALQALDPVPLGQAAHHLKHAGRGDEWAVAAAHAAEQAVALGHEDEAVRLLTDVVRAAPLAAERRAAVAAQLGWAALDTLHAREIIDVLSGVLADDLSAPLRGELRFLLAIALGQAGEDLRRQRELFTGAIDDLSGRPDLRAWAMVALSLTTPPEVSLAEDARWLAQAVELVDQIDDPLLEVFVLGKAGSVLIDTGSASWHDVADRVVRITNGAPRQRREVNAYYSLGVAACYAGHLGTAEFMLNRGLQAPSAQQNQRLEIMIRCGLAVLRYCRGDWDGLRDEVGRLLSDVGDYATSRIDIELAVGCLDLAHGDIDQAQARLQHVVELAVEISAYEVIPLAVESLTRALLARGDVEGGVACLDNLAVLDAKGIWVPIGWTLPVSVDALIAADKRSNAAHLVERAETELAQLDAPLATAALPHARGLLAPSADELAAAAQQYDELPAPYQAARAREQAAGCLFESGSEDEAAALLRRALRDYQHLGASWDRSRAASLARRYGVTVPRVHRGGQRGYGSTLSPREQQVATLAAAGKTNNEIGRELFISTNTVERHLGAVFRKLGARSRTELAHLVGSSSKNDGLR